MTPLAGVGLCCVLVARKYTLKRNVVHASALEKRTENPGSEEQQTSEHSSVNGLRKMEAAENDDVEKKEETNGAL